MRRGCRLWGAWGPFVQRQRKEVRKKNPDNAVVSNDEAGQKLET